MRPDTAVANPIDDLIVEYLEGRLSREEVLEKSETLNERSDSIGWHALMALRSIKVSEDFRKNRAPYFIRDSDLLEWHYSMLKVDKKRKIDSHFISIRPHQIRQASGSLMMSVEIAPEVVNEFLGESELRGLDDLDYFKVYILESETGKQLWLQHYPRGAKDVYQIYASSDTIDDAVKRLIKYLRIQPNQVLAPTDSAPFFRA